MNATISYNTLKERLLKYKKEYEKEMEKLSSTIYPRTRLITEGHIRMLDILLDDIDSMVNWINYENISRGEMNSNSFVLSVDLAKENN